MTLLNGVSQLVGEQLASVAGAGLVLVSPEEDVVAMCECPGAEAVAQTGRFAVGVDPHLAEVRPQPRLDELTHIGGQGLAASGGLLDGRLCVGADAGARYA